MRVAAALHVRNGRLYKAILAALQITSELFQVRDANGALIGAMQGLSADVRRLLPPGKRS